MLRLHQPGAVQAAGAGRELQVPPPALEPPGRHRRPRPAEQGAHGDAEFVGPFGIVATVTGVCSGQGDLRGQEPAGLL